MVVVVVGVVVCGSCGCGCGCRPGGRVYASREAAQKEVDKRPTGRVKARGQAPREGASGTGELQGQGQETNSRKKKKEGRAC